MNDISILQKREKNSGFEVRISSEMEVSLFLYSSFLINHRKRQILRLG